VKRIAACVPDLMDRSKVAAVATGAVFVPEPGDLAGAAQTAGAELILLDLGRPGALAAVADLAAGGVEVIGFASHVELGLLDEARAAGCTTVLTRAIFFRRLRELLTDPLVG
jgi:hypothetical protein